MKYKKTKWNISAKKHSSKIYDILPFVSRFPVISIHILILSRLNPATYVNCYWTRST